MEQAVKTTKKHAGAAQNVLQRVLRSFEAADARELFGLPPLQPVQSFLDAIPSEETWRDVSDWMTRAYAEPHLLYSLSLPWSHTVTELFPVLRRELKRHLLERLRSCRIQCVKSARLLPSGKSPDVSKVLLSVDREGLPQNANPKHCVVYVCSLKKMYDMLRERRDFDLERIGSLHFVVGQSPDLRRLRLKPLIPLEEGDSMLVAMLESAHDVCFAYESFRISALKAAQ